MLAFEFFVTYSRYAIFDSIKQLVKIAAGGDLYYSLGIHCLGDRETPFIPATRDTVPYVRVLGW